MRIFAILIGLMLALGACTSSKFQFYSGPEVTGILVYKGERKMYLMHGNQALKVYDVGLGFTPEGHKEREGDGRTPEGAYMIDRRNPNSQFHLSLGISYPNSKDIAEAKALGEEPGGDIFIHGQPNLFADRRKAKKRGEDWTAGCIAVRNNEIEEIYAMVRTGTIITLRA